MQIELDGSAIDTPDGDRPFEVGVIQRAGSQVRVAVRPLQARFSVWTDRERLYATLLGDHRMAGDAMPPAPGAAEVGAWLHAGARVRRLAHRAGATRVRFVGAVQVEGWVPDAKLLADRRARGATRPCATRPGGGRST